MHHRIFVSSEDEVEKNRVSYSIANYTPLNDFAGKAVNIALEWISVVAASDFDPEYGTDTRHPNGLLLCIQNIRVGNQATSWRRPYTGSILALLPGYAGTGFYGSCQDTPYLQSSALGLVSHGDDLRTLATLEFELFSTGDVVSGIELHDVLNMEDWTASIIFWTVEPERPLTRYDHFNIWVASEDRSSGTVFDCTIPIDLTTFSMYDPQDGYWNAAVSYITPVEQLDVTSAQNTRGLVLVCPNLQNSRSNEPILAVLGRNSVIGEEGYYGARRSIKPVNSDCLGVPLREPIDNLASLRLKILDATTLNPPQNPAGLTEYVVCICVYRLK